MLMPPNKRILIIAGMVLSMAVLIGGWVWWLATRKTISRTPTPSPVASGSYSYRTWNIESDLFSFMVLGVDQTQKTFKLQFLYPKEFQDKIINPKIDCPLSDSKITYTFGLPDTNETIPAERFLYLYDIVPNATVFRGRCGGPECNIIVSSCELVFQR